LKEAKNKPIKLQLEDCRNRKKRKQKRKQTLLKSLRKKEEKHLHLLRKILRKHRLKWKSVKKHFFFKLA
jgi:hypothetical protein